MYDAWQVLGVTPGCDIETARQAYRALAKEHHPDRGGDAQQFRLVREAWELIRTGRAPKPVAQPVNPFAGRPVSFTIAWGTNGLSNTNTGAPGNVTFLFRDR